MQSHAYFCGRVGGTYGPLMKRVNEASAKSPLLQNEAPDLCLATIVFRHCGNKGIGLLDGRVEILNE